jgi:hypothetical protein
MPEPATGDQSRPMNGAGAGPPGARRDLTVRDAILAAVGQNSGVPVWRGAAAAPVEPRDAGSADRGGRSEGRRHA